MTDRQRALEALDRMKQRVDLYFKPIRKRAAFIDVQIIRAALQPEPSVDVLKEEVLSAADQEDQPDGRGWESSDLIAWVIDHLAGRGLLKTGGKIDG